jgi:hypothetical protein
MCTPLDESRLCGATAAADAYCMKVIRDYVLSAPRADTDTAGASDEQLDKLFFWMCTNYKTEGLSGFKAKARDLFAAGASNERADAELTPDRICQIAYMHSSDDDEPLFSFGHRELLEFVAAVRELSK